jgi:hypothetical protein
MAKWIIKMGISGQGHGSRDTAPAWQVQSIEFKSKYHQNK